MPTSGEYQYGDARPVMATIAAAKTAEVGDIFGYSSGTVVKASDEAWVTDLATTRTNFVAKFLGASAQKKAANADPYGNTGENAGKIRVDTGGVRKYAAAAGSYPVGQLVGPAKQSGNALEDNKVDDVSSEAHAIGRVVKEGGTDPAYVLVELLSKVAPAARQA